MASAAPARHPRRDAGALLNRCIHALYDDVLDEPVPQRLIDAVRR